LLNQSPELDTAQAFEESPLPTKNAYKEEEQSDPKPSSTRKQNAPTPTVDAEKISSAEVKEKSKVTPEKTVVPAVAKPVLEEVEEKINMEIADQDLEASELIASDIALAKDVATTPKINARASRITTDTTMAISNNQSKQAKEKASEMKMALVEEQNDEAPFEPTLNPLNAQKRKKPYAANPYQLYNLEQYKEAAPLLEDFLRKSPSDQVLLYLLSVSYLKINQEEKAIEKLSSLKKKVFKGFKPNEVITLIKEGKAEEALQQLQQYTLVNKELILRE